MSIGDTSQFEKPKPDIAGLIDLLRAKGVGSGATLVFEAGDVIPPVPQMGFDLARQLQELVGMGGLLVVPTCTPAEGVPKITFDPQHSPSEAGWFSELFRSLPGVVRSSSPTHSLAAWGGAADQFIAGHRFTSGRRTPWGESAFGTGSPWDRLYDRDALWVILNPAQSGTPFISYLLARCWERQQGITKTTPFPEFDSTLLAQRLERPGLGTVRMWGEHRVLIFRTRRMLDALLDELLHNPQAFGPSARFNDWLALKAEVEQNGHLSAGVCRVNITPPLPFTRWEGRPVTGIFRPLFARAIVFRNADQLAALVVCDLIGLSRDLVQKIRACIHQAAGLPEEAVLIACTHSHSTPDTISAGFEDAAYLNFLVDAVADAVTRAAANLQPVRVGWQRAAIRGLARSRRQKMKDGRVFTTRYGVPSTWRVNPDLVSGEGPIDPDLTVLRIERLDGEVLAAVSNFGCHASVALTSQNFSGDYPGEAMAALEAVLGEGAVVFATNGAAADVDPTLEMPYWGPRSDANARRLGRIFAAQVLETLERISVQEQTELKVAQVLVDLPVRPDWLRLMEEEQERMQQEYAAGWALSPEIARLLAEKTIHTEVQALRLGSLTFTAFPGEVFVETSLNLKAGCPDRTLAVVELANDSIGYIPTRQAFAEGGYETGQHFAARVPPEAETILFEAAQQAIRLTQ